MLRENVSPLSALSLKSINSREIVLELSDNTLLLFSLVENFCSREDKVFSTSSFDFAVLSSLLSEPSKYISVDWMVWILAICFIESEKVVDNFFAATASNNFVDNFKKTLLFSEISSTNVHNSHELSDIFSCKNGFSTIRTLVNTSKQSSTNTKQLTVSIKKMVEEQRNDDLYFLEDHFSVLTKIYSVLKHYLYRIRFESVSKNVHRDLKCYFESSSVQDYQTVRKEKDYDLYINNTKSLDIYLGINNTFATINSSSAENQKPKYLPFFSCESLEKFLILYVISAHLRFDLALNTLITLYFYFCF
jgi:hypothetical protein